MSRLFLHIGIAIASFVFVLAAGYAAFFYYLSAPADFPVGRVVTIQRGESLGQVSAQFKNEHVVRSAFVFRTVGWFMRTEKQIKAGEYFFENKLNAMEIMRDISGDSYKKKLLKLTIPEGSTLADIATALEEKNVMTKKEFFDTVGAPATDCRSSVCLDKKNDFSNTFSFLAVRPGYVSLEGFLFPDTYFVPASITSEESVNIMLQNFEKKVFISDLKKAVEKSGFNLFEIITLASIIEKEASLENDRYLISGVLRKRLEKGMPLQVDAVFPYILGKSGTALTTEDLKVKSPYNTYLYKGLPLGPICNPGISSIKAALFPKDSPFWYYLADSKGNTYYSITYEEHLLKKAKYLK